MTGPAEPPSTAVEQAPAAAPGQWVMPDLTGQNLQAAQNQIQAMTGGQIFFTTSHDAAGRGRNQVVDDNWKVCSQNVAPGAPIDGSARIDFGAVKIAETCP